MKPARSADGPARPLRVAPWGQIGSIESPTGEAPRLVEAVHVAEGQLEAALALADSRRRWRHPSIVPIGDARSESGVGGGPTIRCELASPRGTALSDVLDQAGRLAEPVIGALFRDIARAMAEGHATGLVMGGVAPDHLVVCPPGQEDLPALRVVHAGLAPLVAAARAAPVGADSGGFGQLHSTVEVVPPEVMGGAEWTAAADAYSLCASIARCAIGRHVFSAGQPAALRGIALAGVSGDVAAAITDWLPRLGPAVVKGLQPNPWARAGVIGELGQICDALCAGLPTHGIAERQLVAPWSRGSPIVPLAAYAKASLWADRWVEKALPDAPLRFDAVRSATQRQAATRVGELPPESQAQLRAAMARLDRERARTQQSTDARARTSTARIVAAIVFALAALAVAAIGLRQTHDIAHDELPEFHRSGAPRPPPPPRPKPITLSPYPEGSRPE